MVNRWAIAARPMSGAFALASGAPGSSLPAWPDAATSAPDSTRVPDGLSSASAWAPRSLPAPEPPDPGPDVTREPLGPRLNAPLIPRSSIVSRGASGLRSKLPRNPGRRLIRFPPGPTSNPPRSSRAPIRTTRGLLSLFWSWPIPSPPSPESADAIPPPITSPAATMPAHASKRTTGCATTPHSPQKTLLHRHLTVRFSHIRVNMSPYWSLLAIDTIRRIRHLLLFTRQLRRYSVSCQRGVP